jgi:hypothetical protein
MWRAPSQVVLSVTSACSTTACTAGLGTPEQTYGVECEIAPGRPGNLHATQPWLNNKRKPLQRWPNDTAYDTTCYTYTFTKYDNVLSLASLVDHFQLNIQSLVLDKLDLWWPPVAFTYEFPYIFKPGEEGTITAVLNIARNATYDITVACGLVYYDMNMNNTLNPGTRVSGTH